MSATADTELRELLKNSAQRLLDDLPVEVAASDDLAPAFDAALWRQMAELGWIGIGLSEEQGGSGLGLGEACVIAGEIGRRFCAAPYVAASVMPSALLAECAAVPALSDALAALVAGENLFTLAWQEDAGQPDQQLPRTQLQGLRLRGSKRFVPAAQPGGLLLVSAQADGEPVLVMLRADAAEVVLRCRGTGLGHEASIDFDDVAVLAVLARGTAAQQALQRALTAGRIALAAQLAAVAAGLLDKTLAYVGSRRQFDRPISSFQSIRHRCADLYIASRLAGASWAHALQAYESAPDAAATLAGAALAKARCADAAVQIARESVQMHGAMGFVEEGGVGRGFRAALQGRAWLGSPSSARRRFAIGAGVPA